jgi:hypothetical protein
MSKGVRSDPSLIDSKRHPMKKETPENVKGLKKISDEKRGIQKGKELKNL